MEGEASACEQDGTWNPAGLGCDLQSSEDPGWAKAPLLCRKVGFAGQKLQL